MLLYIITISQVAPVVKNPPANAGDIRGMGLIPGLGRSPGVRNGTPLQYSCLENSMGRGARWAIAYGVAKNWTQLSTYLDVTNYVVNIIIIFFQMFISILYSYTY